jgi:hypothetical protein
VLRTLRQDPEALAQHTISCSMWRANPGYLARDGAQLASVAQQDYGWKEEEVGAGMPAGWGWMAVVAWVLSRGCVSQGCCSSCWLAAGASAA